MYKRQEYDYIFIDWPPVEIVADTQIIEKYADRTIFVVRSGLMERSMLGDIEQFYNCLLYTSSAVHPDVRLILVMCSISTLVCWSVPLVSTTSRR